MAERSIDSFFTKLSTPTKKMPVAADGTATVASSITTISTATPSSTDALKRERDEGDDEVKEHEESDAVHDDKKQKEDTAVTPSSSSPSTLPVLTNSTTTSATSSDGSTTTTKTLHWTQSLSSLLDPSWQPHLRSEFNKPYFAKLCSSLLTASSRAVIYPPHPLIFNAFTLTPFDTVSVVILGQDPYHDTNQAEGLAFSVAPPIRPPSSLQNIFKEIKSDLSIPPPTHGSLRKWAQQGVLLLNTSLTVTAHQPLSHKGFGWEQFTDAVIAAINRDKKGVVFLLWGSHAQKKAANINQGKHHVLKAAHPSGLSAHKGFFGCRHFSQTNAFLKKEGKPEIDWSL
jgi:uracil-DNA glycosylase